jgi:hypothetical protein
MRIDAANHRLTIAPITFDQSKLPDLFHCPTNRRSPCCCFADVRPRFTPCQNRHGLMRFTAAALCRSGEGLPPPRKPVPSSPASTIQATTPACATGRSAAKARAAPEVSLPDDVNRARAWGSEVGRRLIELVEGGKSWVLISAVLKRSMRSLRTCSRYLKRESGNRNA